MSKENPTIKEINKMIEEFEERKQIIEGCIRTLHWEKTKLEIKAKSEEKVT